MVPGECDIARSPGDGPHFSSVSWSSTFYLSSSADKENKRLTRLRVVSLTQNVASGLSQLSPSLALLFGLGT